MKKITFTFIAVIFLAAGAFGQTTLNECFAAGSEQMKQKNYDAAIVTFSKCIRLGTSHWEAYYNRALAYEGKGDLNAAVADATVAVNLVSDNVLPRLKRGALNFALGKLDAALRDLTIVLETDPNNYDALNNRAIVLKNKGKIEEAAADFTHAIKAGPTRPEAYIGRAMAYCKLGKRDLARLDEDAALLRGGKMASFCENIELKDDDAKVAAALGRAEFLEMKAEYDKALTEYAAIIKDHPNEFLAYLNRAKLYKKLNRQDLALADVKRATAIRPNDSEASKLQIEMTAYQIAENMLGPAKPAGKSEVLFNEQFNDNANGWLVGKNAISELQIVDGVYLIETRSSGANTIWLASDKAPKIDPAKDFRITATLKWLNATQQSAIGVVWGLVDANELFELAYRTDGTWFYGKRTRGVNPRANEENVSPDLRKGLYSTNTIELSRSGGSLMVFINGRLNDTIPYESTQAGSKIGFVLYGPNKIQIESLVVEYR